MYSLFPAILKQKPENLMFLLHLTVCVINSLIKIVKADHKRQHNRQVKYVVKRNKEYFIQPVIKNTEVLTILLPLTVCVMNPLINILKADHKRQRKRQVKYVVKRKKDRLFVFGLQSFLNKKRNA